MGQLNKMVMENKELFDYTLDRLKKNIATRFIPERLKDPSYNVDDGARICEIMFKGLCECDILKYDIVVDNFIAFSQEFLRLQAELERTGKYHYGSFLEAQKEIYDNPAVMEGRYLPGLFLSQALWINHQKIQSFFAQEFCSGLLSKGTVIEVPVGTGIFLSRFMESNPSWIGEGYDISSSAVAFSRKVLGYTCSSLSIKVEKEDVFSLPVRQFDRAVCGLLLENMDDPKMLLAKLRGLLAPEGKLFMTASVWASTIDHLHLFKSVQEIKEMIEQYFVIEKDLALPVFQGKKADDEKTPINYACVLRHKL